MKDKELINLDNATTSHLDNELMIWLFITGEDEQVCSMLANLLRMHIRASWKESVSGVKKEYQGTLEDMVQKHVGLEYVVVLGEAVDDQCESRMRPTEWIQTASHVIPKGITQFSN